MVSIVSISSNGTIFRSCLSILTTQPEFVIAVPFEFDLILVKLTELFPA